MAKILCGISGIEFSCEHLSIYLDSREYAHPVFFLPQKKLLGLFQKYRHAELNQIDSYLTFLAYLNSTDLVEFRVPAQRTAATESIVANNFEHLVEVCSKINAIKNPSIRFAHVAITPENKNLENIQYWLLNWESCYDDFRSGYAAQRIKQDLQQIEEKLDYLCADSNRNEMQFASRLAEWADKAGSFPRFPIQVNGTVMQCNEYWKLIIRKCVNSESIAFINSKDLVELTEHCFDNIEAGSNYAFHLFKILKEGALKKQGFFGFADASFHFSILDNNSTVEAANKQVIIQNAPTNKPSRLDYPSNFAFLKAKLAWEMAQDSCEEKRAEEIRTELTRSTDISIPESQVEITGDEIDDDEIDDEGEFNV